ncbi:hypothetical protein SDC9_71690 [bioreactor metagenome]|uniref:Uncharacterized protein n=1 Tax=bioreactor metagenome TaxID=1076179 RepID=A0A644Y9N4_9ZZZZ
MPGGEFEHLRAALRAEDRAGGVRVARLQVDHPRAGAFEGVGEQVDPDPVAVSGHRGEGEPSALCREDRTRVARALGDDGRSRLRECAHREDEPLLPARDHEHIVRIGPVLGGEHAPQLGRSGSRGHQPGAGALRGPRSDAVQILSRQQFRREVPPRERDVLRGAVPAEPSRPIRVHAGGAERLRLPGEIGFGKPLAARDERPPPRLRPHEPCRAELRERSGDRRGARPELSRQLPHAWQLLASHRRRYPGLQKRRNF